jgi:Fic-DOC domain mobile mystery protein B
MSEPPRALFLTPLDHGQTPLDPNEIDGLRLEVSTRAELNDAEEVSIRDGIRWGERQIRHRDPLDLVFARELHRRMFGRVWTWAGTFRTTARNIGVDVDQINICAQQLVDNARYWIEHATFPSDETFARFHHRLVQIHCFPNGNGRHARAMTDLVMMNIGVERFGWGQSMANEARVAYISSLRAGDAGDFASLLAFVRR